MITAEKLDELIESGKLTYKYEHWSSKEVGIAPIDGWDCIRDVIGDAVVELPGGGKLTLEDSFGGEGEGNQYWVVVKVQTGDPMWPVQYFKRLGWYASYDGGFLDGPTVEVTPKQKLVTVWK